MNLALFHHNQNREYRRPQPAATPELSTVQFFALYRGARTGGDFYDFAHIKNHVLTLFCDISGERDEALDIAAAVQERFHQYSAELFSGSDVNGSERLSDLALILNRTILEAAGGPRHTPAFLSSLDPDTGMLTYINAGHLPAFLRDSDSISMLDANGLPLGLFAHSTHDSQVCVVPPASSLLLVSRGLVETRRNHEEFGVERVKESLLVARHVNARELCTSIHSAAQFFLDSKLPENDLTVLAMVRSGAAAQAVSA